MYTTTGKNRMITALGATHVAAFNGDPSAGGTELGRVAVAFAAAAGGAREQTGTAPAIPVTGGNTVNYLAYFDDPAAGNLLMYDPVDPEAYTNDGVYTVNSSAHDLNAVAA